MSMRIVAGVLLSLVILIGCGRPQAEMTEVHEEKATSDSLPTDVPAISVAETDWPWWRGLSQVGIISGQDIPTEWGPETNILWQTEIPGRGHASPTIVGDQIFLATADETAGTQSVLALDKNTGDELWTRQLFKGGLTEENFMHAKSSHASSTIACDGELLFAVFLNDKKLHATALSLTGKVIWQEELGAFSPKFGYAPSPILYESLLIVAADNWGGGYLSALNRATGELVWRIKRPAKSTYASPVIVELADRDLLVISGCEQLAAYNPVTGEEVWAVAGTAEATVGTAVWEGNKVVASGGYPGKDTLCVNAETGEKLWNIRDHLYVPSLVLKDGYIYGVNDKGVGYCWSLEDGKEQWKARIGGNFSASPVLVDGKILISDEEGTTVVFEADPREFKLISKNKLSDEAFASPVVIGDRIYLRHASRKGSRQEILYCIGKSEAL